MHINDKEFSRILIKFERCIKCDTRVCLGQNFILLYFELNLIL